MSVKLYKHNTTGEIIGACPDGSGYLCIHHGEYNTSTPAHYNSSYFDNNYTILQEAPKFHSTAWAWQMMEDGKKVCHSAFGKDSITEILYIYAADGAILTDKGDSFNISFFCGLNENCWQLYEEPKPIVECLPHEFVQGQEVLVKFLSNQVRKNFIWVKRKFSSFCDQGYICSNHNGIQYRHCYEYCIPYVGNEHLEGTLTDGEHGAVPKGYVPPHTPKLGDDDYWMVGDEVVNLSTNKEYVIVSCDHDRVMLTPKKNKNDSIFLPFDAFNGGHCNGHRYLRVWYHKGSYVREDGTVNEYVPTRQHKILHVEDDA